MSKRPPSEFELPRGEPQMDGGLPKAALAHVGKWVACRGEVVVAVVDYPADFGDEVEEGDLLCFVRNPNDIYL